MSTDNLTDKQRLTGWPSVEQSKRLNDLHSAQRWAASSTIGCGGQNRAMTSICRGCIKEISLHAMIHDEMGQSTLIVPIDQNKHQLPPNRINGNTHQGMHMLTVHAQCIAVCVLQCIPCSTFILLQRAPST